MEYTVSHIAKELTQGINESLSVVDFTVNYLFQNMHAIEKNLQERINKITDGQ